MAFSVSPSVIVREVDATAAVPAVATPPAAMAGVFRWGPVNEPILITSEDQLVNRFGKPTDDNYETFFTAADFLAYSNALYVVRADNGSATATATDLVVFPDGTVDEANNDISGQVDVVNSFYGAFEAKYPGELGNSIEVAWVTSTGYSSNYLVGQTGGRIPSNAVSNTSISQTIAFNANAVKFETQPDEKLAELAVGDVLVVGNDSVGYQEITISAWSETEIVDEANTEILVANEYNIGFANRYTLKETDLSALAITNRWRNAGIFGKAPAAGNIHVAVIDTAGSISGAAGTIVEKFENISTTPGAKLPQGTTNYFKDVINNFSSWVNIANTAPIGDASTAKSVYEVFAGGSDAQTESNATLAALGFAYDTLVNANEIDVSFILQGKGDDAGNRANYIVSNLCESRKDCVAFLSPSKEAVVDELKTNAKMNNAIAYRNKIQNSSYWFMDSGYKYRYDKYNDVYRWVPLNGDMAGLASRVEPWESPAGFRKGVIKNVVKLAYNPNKAQRDQLYSADINPVMSQAGQGILLFGDKTGLGLTSAFDRLNVRRLFIAVEKSIASAAESFLFELNDEFTQTQFRNIVEPFLRDIQGRRGIIDFRVISDATVNTPEIIDQNKFRASIFIKPARSINVIELTFVATRTGVEFDEIVGQIA